MAAREAPNVRCHRSIDLRRCIVDVKAMKLRISGTWLINLSLYVRTKLNLYLFCFLLLLSLIAILPLFVFFC